jgi:4a-hydroxytetrahydrobiopterin dehydratase
MSNWEEKANKLDRTFLFKDFEKAMKFVNKVAELAEAENHHPDIFISYNKVALMLCTHDAGYKITEKDRKMATQISSIYTQSL